MNQYIGYITRDEFNATVAHQTHLPTHISICHADTDDGLPNLQLLALVYDLDHLWPDDHRRVLRELCNEPPAQPTAVHSYNLDDDQAGQLRLMGVEVFRGVSEELFQQLAGVRADIKKAA